LSENVEGRSGTVELAAAGDQVERGERHVRVEQGAAT